MSTSAAERQDLGGLRTVYGLPRLFLFTVATIGAAVLIAGFWRRHLVDGSGRDVIAGSTIGDTSVIADTYAERVSVTGVVFVAVAGLALVGRGAFFLFYWGLALAYDISQWSFKIGWYG